MTELENRRPAPDVEGAIAYALGRIERESDPRFHYHSLFHTRDNVLPAAIRLARAVGLTDEQEVLVRVAAAFHDVGMVAQYREHELASIQIARSALSAFRFSPLQVDLIAGMILATRLPQSPVTVCEQVLCDADLEVLGTDEFFERNTCLRLELEALGRRVDDPQWWQDQVAFLNTHRYFTPAARAALDAGKADNLAQVQVLLEQARAKAQERQVVVKSTTVAGRPASKTRPG